MYTFRNLIARLKAINFGVSRNGNLGRNYAEYEGTGQAAVNHLLETKSGQVRGAFFRYDTGPIDIVWGKVTDPIKHTGYGIAHILDKHGKAAVDAIETVIKNGSLKKASNGKQKIINGKWVLILSTEFWGKERHVVISCFDKDANK